MARKGENRNFLLVVYVACDNTLAFAIVVLNQWFLGDCKLIEGRQDAVGHFMWVYSYMNC